MPANTSVCRICLSCNVQTFSLSETPLQLVYEKLTGVPLHSFGNKSPVTACYICNIRLKNCYKLMQMAAKAHKVLTHIVNMFSEVNEIYLLPFNRQTVGLSGSLTVTFPEIIDIPWITNVEPVMNLAPEPEIIIDKDVESSVLLPADSATNVSLDDDPLSLVNYFKTDINVESNQSLQKDPDIPSTAIEDSESDDDVMTLEDDSQVEEDTSDPQPPNIPIAVINIESDDDVMDTASEKAMNSQDGAAPKKRKQSNGKSEDPTEKFKIFTCIKRYECDLCPKKFQYPSVLKQHLLTHTDDMPKCKICLSKVASKKVINVHKALLGGKDPFQCPICDSLFCVKNTFLQHLKTHTGEKFKCDLCEKYFSEKRYLDSHMCCGCA